MRSPLGDPKSLIKQFHLTDRVLLLHTLRALYKTCLERLSRFSTDQKA